MGIFYFNTWIQNRYPLIKENFSKFKIPKIDNLLIDLNCILYKCSFKSSHFKNKLNPIELEQVLINFEVELYKIIKLVMPSKRILISLDGVCPFSKVLNQRKRRFMRFEKEEENYINLCQLIEKNLNIKYEDMDFVSSNEICPASKFMVIISKFIENICFKILKEYELENVKIILSNVDIAGEGEHKIMEFIRNLKKNDVNFNNETHSIYSNDSDLVLLMLLNELDKIFIVKQSFSFSKYDIKHNVISYKDIYENDYEVFNVNFLKEYLILEFKDIFGEENFNIYDVIKDFLLITFLMGNDFIPKAFCLDVMKGNLDLCIDEFKFYYEKHKKTILNHKNEIDYKGLTEIFTNIFKLENIFLDSTINSFNYSLNINKNKGPEYKNSFIYKINWNSKELEYFLGLKKYELKKNSNYEDKMLYGLYNLNIYNSLKRINLKVAKKFYYSQFFDMDIDNINNETIDNICFNYLKMYNWIFDYYTIGCKDWNYYYEYELPPHFDDLINFIKSEKYKKFDFSFEIGKNLNGYEHMMMILPYKNYDILPDKLYELAKKADFYNPDQEIGEPLPVDTFKDYSFKLKLPDLKIKEIKEFINSIDLEDLLKDYKYKFNNNGKLLEIKNSNNINDKINFKFDFKDVKLENEYEGIVVNEYNYEIDENHEVKENLEAKHFPSMLLSKNLKIIPNEKSRKNLISYKLYFKIDNDEIETTYKKYEVIKKNKNINFIYYGYPYKILLKIRKYNDFKDYYFFNEENKKYFCFEIEDQIRKDKHEVEINDKSFKFKNLLFLTNIIDSNLIEKDDVNYYFTNDKESYRILLNPKLYDEHKFYTSILNFYTNETEKNPEIGDQIIDLKTGNLLSISKIEEANLACKLVNENLRGTQNLMLFKDVKISNEWIHISDNFLNRNGFKNSDKLFLTLISSILVTPHKKDFLIDKFDQVYDLGLNFFKIVTNQKIDELVVNYEFVYFQKTKNTNALMKVGKNYYELFFSRKAMSIFIDYIKRFYFIIDSIHFFIYKQNLDLSYDSISSDNLFYYQTNQDPNDLLLEVSTFLDINLKNNKLLAVGGLRMDNFLIDQINNNQPEHKNLDNKVINIDHSNYILVKKLFKTSFPLISNDIPNHKIGDRVVYCDNQSLYCKVGLLGTVIGVYKDIVEILFDKDRNSLKKKKIIIIKWIDVFNLTQWTDLLLNRNNYNKDEVFKGYNKNQHFFSYANNYQFKIMN